MCQLTIYRDIYYRDVELFGSQSTVNYIIQKLCKALQVSRDSINVTAAAKGLVSGHVVIELLDGTVMDLSSGSQVVPELQISPNVRRKL